MNAQHVIKFGHFMKEELDAVLKTIKSRKAAGIYEIAPKIWKTRKFDNILLGFCNAQYKQNPIETSTKGCILLFFMKGDLGIIKNYRTITSTLIAANVYNTWLLIHIQSEVYKILGKNQNGFSEKLIDYF